MSRPVGRSVALHTFMAAALARELVARHHVKIKGAISAARESVQHHTGAEISLVSVKRTFSKLDDADGAMVPVRSGDKWRLDVISQGYIDDAMGRLSESCRRKATSWKPAAAAPPFVMAVAHLFDKLEAGNE